MEIKTKYQYTYFIYPYIISEKKYDKYLINLLCNKNCELKVFEKEKDLSLYTYFLPKVRNYMFWQFNLNKSKIKKLNEFDNNLKAAVLAKYPCTIFEYNINKDIQGKTDATNGIFFNIRKIEIICFNTGICFLSIKTTLNEDSTLSDLCNFNYKFRDINSSVNNFDNIKIQTDIFQNIKGIKTLIKDITGNNVEAKDLNLETERFLTYSYACIGQEEWNADNELLEKEFYKFSNIQPEDYVYDGNNLSKVNKIEKSDYIEYGCTNVGTVLLTSDINIDNYTKLPNKYENDYLYNYIFLLYKKIYLKKIDNEFKTSNKFEISKQRFINFIQGIWIEEVTHDEIGNKLSEEWNKVLNVNKTFIETKQKYDVMYKNANIEKTAKSNKWIAIILAILVIVNIVNCITIFYRR